MKAKNIKEISLLEYNKINFDLNYHFCFMLNNVFKQSFLMIYDFKYNNTFEKYLFKLIFVKYIVQYII